MRLIEKLSTETAFFHAVADAEVMRLMATPTRDEYRRFLRGMIGFVGPVERAIAATPGIERHLDPQPFAKEDRLWNDLSVLGESAEAIAALPRCTVPYLSTIEDALGWAYVVERSTFGHHNLHHFLETVMPAEMTSASSYLRCYFGTSGEQWRQFVIGLEKVEARNWQRVIDAAKTAFRAQRSWRNSTRTIAPMRPAEEKVALLAK